MFLHVRCEHWASEKVYKQKPWTGTEEREREKREGKISTIQRTKQELSGLISSSKVFNSDSLELNSKRQEREQTVILVSVLIPRPCALLQTDRSPAGGRGQRSSRGPRWPPVRRPADWILPSTRRDAMFAVCRREVVRAQRLRWFPRLPFPFRQVCISRYAEGVREASRRCGRHEAESGHAKRRRPRRLPSFGVWTGPAGVVQS